MKVEVAVLGSPSLIVLMVSVDVKHCTDRNCTSAAVFRFRAEELCESLGGRPAGLPVPNSP